MPRKSFDDGSAAQAAESAMPGWTAIEETSLSAPEQTSAAFAPDPTPSADAVMPSLDELRSKYLGASGADPIIDTYAPGSESAETLVEMESNGLRKTVALSKSKKVLWSQG